MIVLVRVMNIIAHSCYVRSLKLEVHLETEVGQSALLLLGVTLFS